jgi:ABC-type sugar transport system substrate-binding protein
MGIVDTQYANDDDAKSYDVAINLIRAHPDLKAIISSSVVRAPAAAHQPEGRRHARRRAARRAIAFNAIVCQKQGSHAGERPAVVRGG